jgi:23S rRNA pseudouridine2605 synthase
MINQGLRLQVFLAYSGTASRRASEKLIAQGRVSVNGKIITVQGTLVFPGDIVMLDGKPLHAENKLHYLVLNKPAGYICSSNDPQGRPLAITLLPQNINERLYNVGRLDFQSSGLILFTNDGDFTQKIEHPATAPEKEYIVNASACIPDSVCDAFLNGIIIDSIKYQAKEAELTDRKTIRIVLIEGKNREIRRVFSHFHLHPLHLLRIRIGPVLLGNLSPGASRNLNQHELKELKTWL